MWEWSMRQKAPFFFTASSCGVEKSYQNGDGKSNDSQGDGKRFVGFYGARGRPVHDRIPDAEEMRERIKADLKR
jgi:hypothetical protein